MNGRLRLRDAMVIAATTLLLLVILEGSARLLGIGAPERERLPAKPAGTFRVLALGGSTVVGVPDGVSGFVAQLERGLRRMAPGRPLDVRNLARSGDPSSAVLANLEHAIGSQPDLVILLTGHNEFLTPPPGALQRARDALHLVRALTGSSEHHAAVEPAFLDALVPVDRAGAVFARATTTFRENLAAAVALAKRAGVPLYLCTAPSNLSDWPPAHRGLAWSPPRPDYEGEIAALRERLAAGDALGVLGATEAGRARYGEDAQLLFLEAKALVALGRADEARGRFERARDRDPIPRRAFGDFNDAVRAHAGPGVRVIDVARDFEARAKEGLVGFELICDNCHPTPLGYAIMAREIAAAMSEDGLFLSKGSPVPDADRWLRGLGSAPGSEAERRSRRVRWLLSNAIYSMKTPFFNFEASRRYLEQTRELAPRDWRVFANLATLDFLGGDLASGRIALERAMALKGAPLDPADRSVTPYLAEALARAGLTAWGSDAGGS